MIAVVWTTRQRMEWIFKLFDFGVENNNVEKIMLISD